MSRFLVTIELEAESLREADKIATGMAEDVQGFIVHVRKGVSVPAREELRSQMADHLDAEVRRIKHREDWEPERIADELLGMAEAEQQR